MSKVEWEAFSIIKGFFFILLTTELLGRLIIYFVFDVGVMGGLNCRIPSRLFSHTRLIFSWSKNLRRCGNINYCWIIFMINKNERRWKGRISLNIFSRTRFINSYIKQIRQGVVVSVCFILIFKWQYFFLNIAFWIFIYSFILISSQLAVIAQN